MTSILPIWPSAAQWKAFGLQLMAPVVTRPLSQLLEPLIGAPFKGFVVPGAAVTAIAVKIPDLGDQVFDVFPWFAVR